MNGVVRLGFRVAALISLAMFLVSLFLPAYITPIEGDFGPELDPMFIDTERGWALLLLGWLAALDLRFGWYANLLLAWSLRRMWTGRSPNMVAALLGALLAASALRPGHIDIGDDHGVNGATIAGAGAWLWAASFVLPAVAAAVGFGRVLVNFGALKLKV